MKPPRNPRRAYDSAGNEIPPIVFCMRTNPLQRSLGRQRRTRNMKAFCAVAAVGLSLVASIGPASAQPYGGRYYEYEERSPRDRDDYEYRERGPRRKDRGYGFDEREYLLCNPDVRRAVNRGQFESAFEHYQKHGRREGRRISC